MSNIEVKLNREGVAELLKSEEMKAICKEYADAALQKLGDGYEVTTYTGKTRANASVHATTYKSRRDNANNNTILKAVTG